MKRIKLCQVLFRKIMTSPISLTFLLVLAVSLSGCGLTQLAEVAPGQEEVVKSVEGKALNKAGAFANHVAKNLDKLTNAAYVEPIDPTKPMVIDNGRIVVRTVDSSVMNMLVAMSGDFTTYKSPPGFWSWMIELTGFGKAAIKGGLPWAWALTEVAKNIGASNTTTVGGDYTRDGSGKHVGDNVGGDQAGRDIHRDSHNDTDNSTHAGAPSAAEE